MEQARTFGSFMEAVERETPLHFVYSSDRVDLLEAIQLDAELESLGEVLEQVSAQTGHSFRQIRERVIVVPRTPLKVREQEKGEVRGRVFDAVSGEPLIGVTIRVETVSGTVGTVTDSNGSYRLQNIPEGPQVLLFSYMGYTSSAEEVLIRADTAEALTVRLKATFDELQEITIVGFRKGQSRALSVQKEALNLKHVVAYEQMERFPDLNVTEAIKRVPGVVTEPQRGEAQSVMIRGLNSSFHTVTLNGQRVASTGETDRETNTAIIPIGMISSMEVVKSVTADMDADATSGSINLLTTRPVGDSVLFKASAATGYNHMSGRPQWLSSATYSQRVGRWDFVLSGTFQQDNRATEDIRHDWGVQDYGQGPQDVLAGLRPSFYETERRRIGIGGQIDYTVSDRSSMYFRAVYNNYDEYEVRNDARLGLDAGNFVAPGQVERGRYEKVLREYNRITNLISLNAGGQQDIGKSTLDYNVGYSYGTFQVPLREYYAFRHAGRPNFSYDISNRQFGSATVSNEVELSDMDQMDFRYYERRRDEVRDTDLFATINLKTPYLLGSGRGYFKVGAKAWQKVKQREMLEQRWTSFDGRLTMADLYAPLDRNLIGGRYPINGQIDWERGKAFFNENEARFGLDENRTRSASDPNNYRAVENIFAGYVMTDYTVGKFSANLGLRAEQVANAYVGNEVFFDAEGNYARTEEVRNDAINYFNLFPMMNLRYALSRDANIRFAYTNTIARPMFSDLVPYRVVNEDNQVILTGNPDLAPSRAHNIDLMFENYFQNVGVLSVGAYFKKLNDFIYNETLFIHDGSEFDGYQLITPLNGEEAFVYGIELAWQQKLDFLPGFLSNFGLYANYTYSRSEAKIIVPNERRIPLPLQTPHVYNVALQYDKGGFSAQLSYNWRDTWLHSVGGSTSAPSIQERGELFLDRYFASIGQLDFTASQRISKNFSSFINLNNLTNSSHVHYFGQPVYPYRASFHSWWGHLGLRYNL
ncbi:MAG: TonB-dependent receptor [Nitritalea sp.]